MRFVEDFGLDSPLPPFRKIAVILTRMETVKSIQVVLVSPDDVHEEQIAVEETIQWARRIERPRGKTQTPKTRRGWQFQTPYLLTHPL